MTRKRICALLLAVLMFLSLGMAFAEVNYPITDKPLALQYWMPINPSAAKYITSYDQNTAYTKMEENTGVDIEWIHPAVGQETEQFKLLFLSDGVPDLVAMADKYPGGEFQGMRDGVFVNLTEYLPKYAPDYWALLQRDDEFRRSVTDENGNIAAFCAYKEAGDPPAIRLIVHEGLLKQLDAKVPTTVNEWEKLFAAMKEAGVASPLVIDPNGICKPFVGAFGTYPGFYVDLDGRVSYGFTTDAFREYLTLMNKWYKAGYISKDFTSLDTNARRTQFDSGEIGCIYDAIVATYNRAKTQNNPILSSPYPRLEPGDSLHWMDDNVAPRWVANECTTAISTGCKNIEAAVQFLNYAYSEKGIELLNWGVEGLNWSWVNGERKYNDLMLSNELYSTEDASYIYKAHFATKYTQRATYCHANLLKSPESLAIRFEYSDDPAVDAAFYLPAFDLPEEQALRRSEIMTDVTTFVNERVLQFIVGTESLDNFDSFISSVNDMGLGEVLEMMQIGYTSYMNK